MGSFEIVGPEIEHYILTRRGIAYPDGRMSEIRSDFVPLGTRQERHPQRGAGRLLSPEGETDQKEKC